MNLRQSISLQETGTAGKSVSVWTVFLSVTSFTIHITIRSVASNNRVQSSVAIFTFEAFYMPFLLLYENTKLNERLKETGIRDGHYVCDITLEFVRITFISQNGLLMLVVLDVCLVLMENSLLLGGHSVKIITTNVEEVVKKKVSYKSALIKVNPSNIY